MSQPVENVNGPPSGGMGSQAPPQAPAWDAERILLDLAVKRGLLDVRTAQSFLVARQQNRMSVLEALVRTNTLSSEVVARLRADVTTLIRSSSSGSGQIALPPRPVVVRPPGDSVLSSAPPVDFSASNPSSSGSNAGPRASGMRPPLPVSAPPVSSSASRNVSNSSVITGAKPYSDAGPPTSETVQPSTRRDPSVNSTRRDTVGDSGGAFRPKVGQRFGRYELQGELGRGGMGIVFKARQVELERDVALKMLLAGGAATDLDRDRFFREARNAAKLVHPNIVAVHDVGEHEGVHFFTMDYVDGTDLSSLIQKGEVDVPRAIEFGIQLADALSYAHAAGVVHRDIKPSNVLVNKQGAARITDFGIAKDLEKSSTTRQGEVMGTPSYMPPEQADGRAVDVDHRADIYSLGAVLYEMLTGRPPFVAKTSLQVMNAVLHERPEPPSKLNPKIPYDLETVILKCLEKQCHDRYESAKALERDLKAVKRGDLIEAERSHIDLSGARKKLPIVAAIVGALVVLGGGGIALSSWLSARERDRILADEKAKEEAAKKLAELEAKKKRDAEDLARRERALAGIQAALDAAARDEPDVAIARAAEAVDLAPKLPKARETLGRLYLELRQDGERALAEANAALESDPRYVDARALKARAFVALDRGNEALVEISNLEAQGPSEARVAARLRGEVLLARNDAKGAVRELERASELGAQDPIARFLLAKAYFVDGRFSDAERAATFAMEADPGKAPPILLRAEARVKLGRMREALEDAKAASVIAPADPRIRALVEQLEGGRRPQLPVQPPRNEEPDAADKEQHAAADAAKMALLRGDRGPAEKWLAAPRSEKECTYVLNARGWLLWRLGRLDEAEVEYGKILSVEPSAPIYGNRGLVRNGLRKWDLALEDFDKALPSGAKVQVGLLPAVAGRATALAAKEQWAEAEAAWNLAVEMAPVKPPIKASYLHDRSKFYLHRDKIAESLRDIDEAITLNPASGHYLDDRGDLREKQGDTVRALEDWKAALTKQLPADEVGQVRAKIERVERGGKK